MNYLKKALEKATPLDLKRRLNLRGTDTNLDTANFGGSLSSADNTAQKAFDTLDDHTHTTTFTGLTDTPGSITAGNLYQGNSGGTALEALAPSTSGNVLTSNGSKWTSAVPDTDPAGKLIAIIEDQQTSGTDGGGFTSGAAQTRTLNKLVYNRDTTVSLSSNQFTLPAGDWEIHWTAPGHRVDAHQSFLYNITGAAEVKRGTVMEAINASPGTGNRSEGSARVSIGTSTAYEIRHECETTKTTDGFGHAGGFGTEVFTKVIIRENTAAAAGGGGGSGSSIQLAQMSNSSTQTIANSTLETIVWDTEDYDTTTDGVVDLTNNQFKIPSSLDGAYIQCGASKFYNPSFSGSHYQNLIIEHDDGVTTTAIGYVEKNAIFRGREITTARPIQVNTDDTIQFITQQNSGVNQTLAAGCWAYLKVLST